MLKKLARSALKPIAAAADILRPPRAGITVLIYHRVGAGSGGEVDLDTFMFADQMAELAESTRVVSLDDAVEALAKERQPGATQQSRVVVTFDDGTPDVVEHALPILEHYKVPMTLYLATQSVQDQVGFWDPADTPLSWQGVRELTSSGLVQIGSHTHSHALLDRLAHDQIAGELDTSIDLIAENVGAHPRHFAYPKALRPSPAADAAVRSRFASAAIAGTRPNVYGASDVYLLARSPIQRSDGMRWFHRKTSGGMGFEDRLRDRINARRYADATR